MSRAAGRAPAGFKEPAGAPPRSAQAPRRAVFLLLAAACGLCVANLYYLQPILPQVAASMHRAPGTLTSAVSSTQLGYAVGLCLIVPLGDAVDRKRLLTILTGAAVAVLAVIPFTSGTLFPALFFALGAVSVAAMIIVPQAAGMAPPEQRGAVVGTVMTGLILGALLCRTFAGIVASLAGWRVVYWGAAVLMVGVLVTLRCIVPSQPPRDRLTLGTYLLLLKSIVSLARKGNVLRERSLYGALGFAAFNILWTSVPLRLIAAPYHCNSAEIGAMGLLGAGGALGATVAGRLADRGRQVVTTIVSFVIIVASFALARELSGSIIVLSLAIFLIDFAVQSAHITNQATVFAHSDDNARSRVTTVYMTCYFAGGAIGSELTGSAWARGGWSDTALLGSIAGIAALLLICIFSATTLLRRRTASTPV